MIARSGYQFLHELHYLGPWSIFDAYVYLQDIVTTRFFYLFSLWCVLLPLYHYLLLITLSPSLSPFFSLALSFSPFRSLSLSFITFFCLFVRLYAQLSPSHDGSRANRREDLRVQYKSFRHASTMQIIGVTRATRSSASRDAQKTSTSNKHNLYVGWWLLRIKRR